MAESDMVHVVVYRTIYGSASIPRALYNDALALGCVDADGGLSGDALAAAVEHLDGDGGHWPALEADHEITEELEIVCFPDEEVV